MSALLLEDQPGLATRAVHAGLAPDPATGAILTPIYQSTTFVQEAVGVHRGYTYSRAANPTVAALERNLAGIEGAAHAVAFKTGLSALTVLFLSLLRAGDHVVASDVIYGGTVRLLRDLLGPLGVRAQFVDSSDTAELEAALRPETKLVLIETPANPTLKLTDVGAVAELCRTHGVPLAVDNTFLTAALQPVLELGADIAVYSTTKYVEGHDSTTGGALLTDGGALAERFGLLRCATGTNQSPFEAWLTLRGIKTLPLRLRRHSESALVVARFLAEHPAVARIAYPGLEDFEQHQLAARQQRAGGGVLAFELEGGEPAGRRLMNSVELCSLAENLGAAETLITHPATMTHAQIEPAERRRLGIADGLVRLSVGLEDPADIVADLTRALDVAGGAR